jgi:hypothetical protein
MDNSGQQSRGEILIYDTFNTAQLALLVKDNGNAATAGRNGNDVLSDQVFNHLRIDNAFRFRCRHNPPPDAPGIFRKCPAILLTPPNGRLIIHKGAYRLTWVLESLIIGVNLHQGN